jgi:hypothetical protein
MNRKASYSISAGKIKKLNSLGVEKRGCLLQSNDLTTIEAEAKQEVAYATLK